MRPALIALALTVFAFAAAPPARLAAEATPPAPNVEAATTIEVTATSTPGVTGSHRQRTTRRPAGSPSSGGS